MFENRTGGLPDAESAASYAERVGWTEHAVLADPAEAILNRTPYDGNGLPGLCALTPQMELLACTKGHGKYADLMDEIVDHAAR